MDGQTAMSWRRQYFRLLLIMGPVLLALPFLMALIADAVISGEPDEFDVAAGPGVFSIVMFFVPATSTFAWSVGKRMKLWFASFFPLVAAWVCGVLIVDGVSKYSVNWPKFVMYMGLSAPAALLLGIGLIWISRERG